MDDNSTQAPQPGQVTTPSSSPGWNQFIGQIVQWEDGTCWYVQADGRHLIPDDGTLEILEQRGFKFITLSAEDLHAIPSIIDNPVASMVNNQTSQNNT